MPQEQTDDLPKDIIKEDLFRFPHKPHLSLYLIILTKN